MEPAEQAGESPVVISLEGRSGVDGSFRICWTLRLTEKLKLWASGGDCNGQAIASSLMITGNCAAFAIRIGDICSWRLCDIDCYFI